MARRSFTKRGLESMERARARRREKYIGTVVGNWEVVKFTGDTVPQKSGDRQHNVYIVRCTRCQAERTANPHQLRNRPKCAKCGTRQRVPSPQKEGPSRIPGTPWDEDPVCLEFLKQHPHGATLTDVGRAYGVSRERIRQILDGAMAKIAKRYGKDAAIKSLLNHQRPRNAWEEIESLAFDAPIGNDKHRRWGHIRCGCESCKRLKSESREERLKRHGLQG